MRMSSLILLCLSFVFVSGVFAPMFSAQSQGKEKRKPVRFYMVAVPDSVRHQLEVYLEEHEKIKVSTFMWIYNQLDVKDVQYKDGIYSFQLNSPHADRRLFITHQGQLTIFESRYINDLLQEYLTYIQKHDLPVATRIQYLKVISKFLEKEFES